MSLLHVILHLFGRNVTDVDVENPALRCPNNSIDKHRVLDEDELAPDSTGRLKDRRAVRKEGIITEEPEVSDLPVLQRLVPTRDPAEADSHRILRIVSLLTLNLSDGNGIGIHDAVLRVNVVEEEEVSVLAEVPHPHRKVEIDVQDVVEEVGEKLLDGSVLRVDVKNSSRVILRGSLLSVDVERRGNLGSRLHLREVRVPRHSVICTIRRDRARVDIRDIPPKHLVRG